MSEIIHVDATVSLHGYQAWRRSLGMLPVGTIIQWNEPYNSFTESDHIKVGQRFMITEVMPRLLGQSNLACDNVYKMVLVSKTGKEFKRKTYWGETIARRLVQETIEIVV